MSTNLSTEITSFFNNIQLSENSASVNIPINGTTGFQFTVPLSTGTSNQAQEFLGIFSLLSALVETATNHPATQPKT